MAASQNDAMQVVDGSYARYDLTCVWPTAEYSKQLQNQCHKGYVALKPK